MRPSRAAWLAGWLLLRCRAEQDTVLYTGPCHTILPNPSPDSSYLATRPEATDTWVSNSKTGTKLAYHASSLLITAAFTTKALFQSSPQPSLTSLTKKQTERRATLAFAACPHQYFTTV
uniref:Secreted protein n=1 Tax=Oryza meridionalis TaxID=40149 RepID=A0A0E0DK36_9ORYZ